jgi:membrane-bound lytic murein transglycosylase F
MKYGYARGGEALHFAENIRSYYDILLRLEPAFDPMIQLGSGEESLAAPG